MRRSLIAVLGSSLIALSASRTPAIESHNEEEIAIQGRTSMAIVNELNIRYPKDNENKIGARVANIAIESGDIDFQSFYLGIRYIRTLPLRVFIIYQIREACDWVAEEFSFRKARRYINA